MADPGQLALIKRSVDKWNKWRIAHPDVEVDLSGADLRYTDLRGARLKEANLSGADLRYAHLRVTDLGEAHLNRADLRYADLSRAHLSGARLSGADLSGAHLSKAYLSDADLSGAHLNRAHLSGANLNSADLSDADLTGADLTGADLTGVKGLHSPTKSQPQSSQSPSTTNWLSLVETFGGNLLVAAATLASIVQGLDVIERRWREKKEKQKQKKPPAPPSSKEIIEIRLVMDDGSRHSFTRWISDPDELRAYIDAFSDPTSKVKPLQVTFMKREGRPLVVDVTKGGKDNLQLNVILGYLEAE